MGHTELPGEKTEVPEPFTLVIFGATGDLTRRKLVPAIYNLFRQGLLPEPFRIVGFARRPMSDEEFRRDMHEGIGQFLTRPIEEESWSRFAPTMVYHQGNFREAEGFVSLARRLESDVFPANRLFYLASQPSEFSQVVSQVGRAALVRKEPGAWCRLIVEKPFGRDLASARELNDCIGRVFGESQIFRIDHYLGKETVQNILVLRFGNSLFEPLWNHKYVDHVQVTVSERVGVAGRGEYYEQAGALRDMVQNHVMHLLSLVAMESPVALDADAVRDEKVKVLRALRPIAPECAAAELVRGQYTAGAVGGQKVPGYRQEEEVAPDSDTETFAALKLFIDNWRWSGVPFFVRTGKRLPAHVTEIGIHFRSVPQVLFNLGRTAPMLPNVLALRIQPNEGISLRFQVKVPGLGMRIQPLEMAFSYAESFGTAPPEAYERLLLDAALGDATLFTRSDEVEAAWTFVTPLLEACGEKSPAVYEAGSWGPKEADELIEADGRRWQVLRPPVRHG